MAGKNQGTVKKQTKAMVTKQAGKLVASDPAKAARKRAEAVDLDSLKTINEFRELVADLMQAMGLEVKRGG